MDRRNLGDSNTGQIGYLARSYSLEDQLGEMFNDDSDEAGNSYEYEADTSSETRTFLTNPVSGRRVVANPKATRGMKTVDKATLISYFNEIESKFSELPAGTLLYMLHHEAGNGPIYNPGIIGGSGGKYRGLFQFYHQERNSKGTFAWGAARAELARRGIALPALTEAWDDPFYNSLAAAGLALANRRTVERILGRDAVRSWTPIVFYAAHQQGAGYLIDAVRTGRPGPLQGRQSQRSVSALTVDLARAIA